MGWGNGDDFNQALLEALVEGQSGSGSDGGQGQHGVCWQTLSLETHYIQVIEQVRKFSMCRYISTFPIWKWGISRNRCYCWWFRNPKQPPGRCFKPPMNTGGYLYYINCWVCRISEPSTVVSQEVLLPRSLPKLEDLPPLQLVWLRWPRSSNWLLKFPPPAYGKEQKPSGFLVGHISGTFFCSSPWGKQDLVPKNQFGGVFFGCFGWSGKLPTLGGLRCWVRPWWCQTSSPTARHSWPSRRPTTGKKGLEPQMDG